MTKEATGRRARKENESTSLVAVTKIDATRHWRAAVKTATDGAGVLAAGSEKSQQNNEAPGLRTEMKAMQMVELRTAADEREAKV
mmetsp:Transcript_30214/g.48793  ORF Transcript_30214/g.48793 Transcript_30214/m.48793 type:complete len:85 (+) Transcript_30214:1812-2066(+)